MPDLFFDAVPLSDQIAEEMHVWENALEVTDAQP
jgi:hypothetical protein